MTSAGKIAQKIIFNIPIQTMSPLRIASGLDDGLIDILILKNKQGRPFIPGTSLAGVLRSEIDALYGEKIGDKIFGSIDNNGNQSMINISDITLTQAQLIHRDGVAINAFTGVGEDGAKYDYEAIDRGAQGTLKMELTIRCGDLETTLDTSAKHNQFSATDEQYIDIAASIADIITKGINIGSLTTKGYGKLASTKPVEIHVFNFASAQDADKWLQYLQKGTLPQAVYLGDAKNIHAQAVNNFEMTAEFALQSSMLIRDEAERKERGDNIAIQMISGQDYVIPGTSLKGILRNRACKIMTALCRDNEQKANRYVNDLMGFAEKETAKKSRLSVDEVYISCDQLHKSKHSRNRIDRFTGGTIPSALFTEEPIWQHDKTLAPIKMTVKIDKCRPSEAGLLMLILKDLWLGRLPIGGGKSIGRGILIGKSCTIAYDGKTIHLDANGRPNSTEHQDLLENCVQKLIREVKSSD